MGFRLLFSPHGSILLYAINLCECLLAFLQSFYIAKLGDEVCQSGSQTCSAGCHRLVPVWFTCVDFVVTLKIDTSMHAAKARTH